MNYILIDCIKVQNANAVAGLTWGFPAITHFLGFAHNLARKLSRTELQDISLTGCAVVCHDHKVHTYGAPYDTQFTQSRNPASLKKDVTKLVGEGKTPSVIEEGKMNMTLSLIIGCNGNLGNRNGRLLDWVKKQCMLQRLAGGTVLSIEEIEIFGDDNGSLRQIKFRLLPGFVLMDRSYELRKHFNSLEQQNPAVELLDAWLDFAALKQKARPKSNLISEHLEKLVKAEPENPGHIKLLSTWEEHLQDPYSEGDVPDLLINHFGALEDRKDNKALLEQWQGYQTPTEETAADWEYVRKPAAGYLVPIMTGYKAISKVYANEEVKNTRDNETDVCFVEAVHGVGEWQSVHRLSSAAELRKCLWHIHHEENWYLCKQEESEAAIGNNIESRGDSIEYEEDFS